MNALCGLVLRYESREFHDKIIFFKMLAVYWAETVLLTFLGFRYIVLETFSIHVLGILCAL